MAPPATKNFRQSQPITTGLRIVCESYPANTCLRELLQNADDAGATEIEYVLDTKTYTSNPLLYEALQEYHGPALLARNDSVFTDEDFSSLSSVGDSRKRNDATTTGKFGLGFNSVYHWTDGPWIYSRNWLLLLDPHEWWSGDSEGRGGPAWDVVENRDCVELQNHLQTFQAFDLDTSQAVQQTIIRIPLRTAGQAVRSKIVGREIAVDEIKAALEQFAEEMKDGGLLFLKHIRTVILRIDNETMSKIEILEEGSDLRARREIPADFKKLYVPQTPLAMERDLSRNLSLRIEFSNTIYSSVQSYLIQHAMIKSSGNSDLDDWARQRKLFPWTAVAVPLDKTLSETPFCGRLYCTLRMPILTNHPAHIHGLWAITPDRSRLSSSGQSPGYEDEATRWNKFMFQTCVSSSWGKLLLQRSHSSFREERYNLWPQVTSSPVDLWGRLDDWVIDVIISEGLPVWNAIDKCVAIGMAQFFLDDATNKKYVSAIASVMPSAVFLTESLLGKVIRRSTILRTPKRVATCSTVREFLQQTLPVIPNSIAPLLLEYCLLDALKSELKNKLRCTLYEGFHGIPIWPIVSGGMSVAGQLLLPRNEQEMDLFKEARRTQTIDIKRFTPPLLKLFLNDISYMSAIMRHRTIADLGTDWPLIYPNSEQRSDSASLLRRKASLEMTLKNIWEWISRRHSLDNLELPSTCYGLWIVPVNNYRIRQFAPSGGATPMLVASKSGPLYRLMVEITQDSHVEAPPILDIEALPSDAVKFLRKQATEVRTFRGTSMNDFASFASWLAASKDILAAANEQQKVSLLQQLELLAKKRNNSSEENLVRDNLKRLPLFNKVECSAPFEKQDLKRCDLMGYKHSLVIPKNLPPLPQIQDIAFFDLSSPAEKSLDRSFSLLEMMPLKSLLENHLLPWVVSADGSLDAVKDCLIDFIFSNELSRNPLSSWVDLIANKPIIPISTHGNNRSRRRRCIVDLVRPQTLLSRLYFEHEDVHPEPGFFQKHEAALISCHIKSEPTWADLVGRIYFFSRCLVDAKELLEKVQMLLSIPPPLEFISDESNRSRIQKLKWLPGIPMTGTQLSLLSPQDCRGPDQRSLTNYVLGTTTLSPSENWKTILGWDEPIPSKLLFRQLDICLEINDHDKVHQILLYLKPHEYSDLQVKKCILGSRKDYRNANESFLPNSLLSKYPMFPYLDEVDSIFAHFHPVLMEVLKVRCEPSITDLIKVQRSLQAAAPTLKHSDLIVAVSSLEIAVHLPATEELTDILIPDSQNVLRNLWDIVHGNQNVTGAIADFHYTHSMVSANVIERLGVENSLARATRLAIEVEDEDEDEYTLEEKLTDIISDTLARYSMQSTFNEYLANADDCGATKISWILDECENGRHASEALLTPELEAFQGPALIVHNDQIFSEKDFQGLKAIGRGGKGDNPTSTGMFGRGAISMYHFTDVPMIVSGDSFLILDPQQSFLPRNKRQRRKVGVKITLTTARRICAGNLVPFHGLCGFSSDMDYYSGTLFRFPFRGSRATRLKEINFGIGAEKTKSLLDKYFEDASMALLFLRNTKSIDCFIRGEDRPRWCVSASRSEVSEDQIFQQIKVRSQKENQPTIERIWRIRMTDIISCPANIVKPGRGAGKITECGIAACISDQRASQRIFCTLPTPFRSCIPISFHASFAVTGDRNSIPFEDTRRDPVVAEWNSWLLTSCIPNSYLDFLKDLAPRIGEESFRYWPLITNQEYATPPTHAVIKAFWNILSDDDGIQLFPLARPLHAANSAPPLTKKSAAKVGTSYPTTSLRTAQFDALPPKVSWYLRPLFQKICPFLVVLPPSLAETMQNNKAGGLMTILGPEFLCGLFREEHNCKILADFYAQGPESKTGGPKALELLLNILVAKVGTSSEALSYLNGCRILPKLDGSLGLLTLGLDADTEWNLIADEAEQRLFGFAASSFVNTNLFQRSSSHLSIDFSSYTTLNNPIKDIINSKLNVRPLEFQDLGKLLARDNAPIHPKYGGDRDSWIEQFWLYLNKRLSMEHVKSLREDAVLSITQILAESGLQDKLIYRTVGNGQPQYLTPTQFDTGAWIVKPSNAEHEILCLAITDLRLADRACLPYWLLTAESDLNVAPSFVRFIQALKVIERRSKKSITTYLGQALTQKTRKVLCDVLKNYLKNENVEADNMSILKALPVWPSHNNHDKTGISAQQALCCHYAAMFMPWMNLAHFIRPEIVLLERKSLLALDCKIMKIDQAWEYVAQNFPTSLDAVNPKDYCALIQQIASSGLKTSLKIAPNGHGILCKPSSLYDCHDEIFCAAFRNQKAVRFLHKDLRGQDLDAFWKESGLRARPASGDMGGADFLQCALAIKSRIGDSSNPDFIRDAEKVASYLSWDRPSLRVWTNDTWSTLSEISMFPVADGLSTPLAYRQNRMNELAQNKPHCSLQELGREADRRIIWSQKPFPQRPLTPFAFDRIANQGCPTATTVLCHVKHLIEMRTTVNSGELAEYLRDLQASYTYLQDLAERTKIIPGVRSANIWINIDTTDVDKVSVNDIDSALYPAQMLCMNCPTDPLPLKVVRKFLVPYEKLLAILGCPSVIQPAKGPKRPSGNIGSPMTSAMKEIQKFRQEGTFVDIIFEAEGMQKPAHKIFMAAVSRYCNRQFTGEWGRLLSERTGTIHIPDIRFKTLSQMVDFAYTGEIEFEQVMDQTDNDEIAERLDDLFDLLRSADMWILEQLHQLIEDQVIDHSDLFVRPDNVSDVLVMAKEVRALRLVRHCESFIANNRRFVEAFK